jgi:hypothetical protein
MSQARLFLAADRDAIAVGIDGVLDDVSEDHRSRLLEGL